MTNFKNVFTFFLTFVVGFSGVAFMPEIKDAFETKVVEARGLSGQSSPVFRATRSSRSVGQRVNGGAVLGQTFDPSSCEVYIYDYLKFGQDNEATEVAKLQKFLNEFVEAEVVENGVFDFATFNAVKDLQAKFADEILKPWVDAGVVAELQPTGYVYKTTKHFINTNHCPDLDIPMPSLN